MSEHLSLIFLACFISTIGSSTSVPSPGRSLLLIFGVLVQFVLKLINAILLALHRAAIPNALNLVSNALLLFYLLLAPIESINRNFETLAIVYVVTTNLPLLIATLVLFATSLRDSIPSAKSFSLTDARKIVKLGLAFFWLQIMAMIILSTNNFLISIFVSAEEVIPFQTYFKLFSLISTFFSLGMIPLWSSMAEAQAKRITIGSSIPGEACI